MKDIKIRSISLKSYNGLKDITIDCSKSDTELYQWTVLLGNNNSGKTRILQAIADMRPITWIDGNGKEIIVPAIWDKIKKVDETYIDCNLTSYEKIWSTPLFVNEDYLQKQIVNLHIFGYGVSRYPAVNSNNLSDQEQESGDCETLFSFGKRLVNIQEWLMQLDYSVKNNNQAMQKRLDKVREVICSDLFPEIEDFKFESSDAGRNYMLFKTKDGWFRYNELGSGYQTMLSWVVDLCKRMFETFPKSDNPLLENAVVLVDEIDLNLHPKWQREVIPYISDFFKNVQFIVTTHNPLIIQSIQEINLYVLHSEDDDKITVERSKQTNFSGWSVEEILRDTMNLDNDIHSDYFQHSYKMFEDGLDNNDIKKAQKAYNSLEKILHPSNSLRRLLEFQLSQMDVND